MFGGLDLIDGSPASAASELRQGSRLTGWALACGQTPEHVLVLADGVVVGRAKRFGPPRPDVVAATGSRAPSTWSIEADTRGLPPGERVLEVFVQSREGKARITGEQTVWVESVLPAMATRAAALLREHQDRAGYWLTRHTVEPRFERPGREMNTFLTATLVDLLAPVAGDHGLQDVVERARRHLTAQIEPDGLVRYHGLPDGPGMGTLGCPITPDADDTALVWKIAPPPAGDRRRGSMLEVLAGYRDPRGLYRTWLAPQERYECLNPGRDPNPPDVAIQMNVLLMLAGNDPAAASSLCRALQEHIGDESLWVYYARAPLVPLLRRNDLRRAGCPVEVPPERVVWEEGQGRWVDAAHRLGDPEAPAHPHRSDAAMLALLAELGRDDFATLRATPPLLYHNDLTASVSRYYWSEDVGYALWLRLYEEVRAAAERSPGGGR
jgi:hypothetical protein